MRAGTCGIDIDPRIVETVDERENRGPMKTGAKFDE